MRVPLIFQNEAAECGIACLAMVAGAYGDRRGLAALRGESSLRGLSLDRLMDRAEALGLCVRAARIELDDLRELRRPAILHWNLDHFVVLVGSDRRGIEVHDPASGAHHYTWREASRKFTGVALELWPGETFEPVRDKPVVDWKKLIGPVPGLFSATARIISLALMLELLMIAAPFFMQTVIDHVLVGHDLDLLNLLVIAFLGMLVLQSGIGALRAWSVTSLTNTLGVLWQGRLFRHLLRLPLRYFEKRSLGEVLSRFDSMESIQRTFGGSFVELVMDGLMGVLTLTLMLAYSSALVLITVAVLALYFIVQQGFFRVVFERTNSEIVAAARLQTHAVESIRGVQCLKLFNAERARLSHWQNLQVDDVNQKLFIARYAIGFRMFNMLLVGAERIVIVWLAAQFVLAGDFSVGMLVAYLAYRDQFATRAHGLVDRIMEFRMLRLHAERLMDVIGSETEKLPAGMAVRGIESIDANDLCFRYGEDESLVIRDLNLHIERGETVAIVGPSGCGKTTLLKLLLGLLKPHTGCVKINGHALTALNIRAYRQLCGTVMQEDQLFAGSISDNIAFFATRADAKRIRDSAALAAIDGDIAAMPMGYHSLVGDMGSSLSGGQKQRVLLARALYRQPRLLLLDEATSHLDVTTEQMVNQSIQQLSVTRIIVAHRPETIASADRVLVMDAGKVVDEYRPRRNDAPAPQQAPATSMQA